MIIDLTWKDSRQISRWEHIEDIEEDVCVVKTRGWLIKETDDAYVVALSVGDDGLQACGINIIPKCCVEKVEIKED